MKKKEKQLDITSVCFFNFPHQPGIKLVPRKDVYGGDIQTHGDYNSMFSTPSAPSKPQRQIFKFILLDNRKKMTTE